MEPLFDVYARHNMRVQLVAALLAGGRHSRDTVLINEANLMIDELEKAALVDKERDKERARELDAQFEKDRQRVRDTQAFAIPARPGEGSEPGNL